MKRDDRVRLRHMLDAAIEAQTFVAGRTRIDLDSDRMLSLAVVRSIEIIGEVATRVSGETRAANPDIPWPSIVAMRNRLIHAYYDIDLDRVWETLTDELSPLIRGLHQALADE